MSSQFPEDLFIEKSKIQAQLSAGVASPEVIAHGTATSGDAAPVGRKNVRLLGLLAAATLVTMASALAYFVFLQPSEPAPPTQWTETSLGPVNAADLYDYYVARIDDDSIFQIIPETEEGWAYFSAFMYKLADYKAAEAIRGKLTDEQKQEMLALNQRFVNLQDLELTVDITRTDGSKFYHDGKPPARG